MLFSNQRKHLLSLPPKDVEGKRVNMAFLVRHLCKHLMKNQRQELFIVDNAMYVLSLSDQFGWLQRNYGSSAVKTARNLSPNKRCRLGA